MRLIIWICAQFDIDLPSYGIVDSIVQTMPSDTFINVLTLCVAGAGAGVGIGMVLVVGMPLVEKKHKIHIFKLLELKITKSPIHVFLKIWIPYSICPFN